jgi:hypothetical protein
LITLQRSEKFLALPDRHKSTKNEFWRWERPLGEKSGAVSRIDTPPLNFVARMIRAVVIVLLLIRYSSAIAVDYERFEEKGKVGIRDATGKVILAASFDALGWSDGQFSVIGQITGYRLNGKWGLLTLSKQFITPSEYETLVSSGGDRLVASKRLNPFTTKFGSLDLAGKVVIPFVYDAIDFHGMRAIVMVKNGPRYEHGLVDLNDRTILPVKFKSIKSIGTLRYVVEDFNGKSALSTEEGKWVTDFVIDGISEFTNDLAVISQDWKRGIIDRNGTIKAEPIYREAKVTGPGTAVVRKADEWRLVDEKFHDLQRAEGDAIIFKENGWGQITIAGKTGFIDANFNPAWPIEFDYIGDIANGKVVVGRNKKYGMLRLDRSEVLPFEFDSLCVDKSFIRAMKRTGGRRTWVLMDTFGVQKTNKTYQFIWPYRSKLLVVKDRGFFGAIDRYGKESVACVYDSILEANDELVVVKFRGQYGIINHVDQWKLLPQRFPLKLVSEKSYLALEPDLYFFKDLAGNILYFSNNPIRALTDNLEERLPDGAIKRINFQGQVVVPEKTRLEVVTQAQEVFRETEGLRGIKRDGKFGFVDDRGRLRIANRYEDIGEFHNGLAPIKLLGKWGFINPADQIVIQPTFDAAENFQQSSVIVWRKGKAGMIDKRGNTLLEIRYDSIKRLANELISIKTGMLHGLADSNGRILIEPRFDTMEPVTGDLVIVSRGKLYGVLAKDGTGIFPLQFSELRYIQSRKAFLVRKVNDWETLRLSGE